MTVDADLGCTIQAEPTSNMAGASALRITIVLTRPIEIRLDRLLAMGFGASR